MSCYIKVYGRVRPSTSSSQQIALTVVDKLRVKVEADGKCEKLYELHRIFAVDIAQEDVFTTAAKKMVEECTEGINGTIFAYGQTGSGKTHTMLGPADSWSDPVAKGLIPRSVEHLFAQLELKAQECQKFSFKVNVEFVELYNDDIFDLLRSDSNKITLRDTGNDITLVGAKSESVDNSLDLMHVVKRGWQSRRTAATAMNRDSSRSHALLIIKVCTEEVTGSLKTNRSSILNLVDLAGSERQSHTKASGERLKEATNINSSLTVLGRCIRLLSKPATSQSFIPYRDSHLTHILKNSLGGNSKTAVIVNMHPDRSYVAESSSTLQFAEACTMIKNRVLRNEVMSGDQENSYKKAIHELRQEIDETRAKAREEFARRLEESEKNYHQLLAESTALKSEHTELRFKYNVGLVRYAMEAHNEDLPMFIKEYMMASGPEKEIVGKTIALELDATNKRCQLLQEQRDELRERLQQSLNSTIPMQTPCGKQRRQSSRPQRRETVYKHSPSRLAELSELAREDDQLQEAELRVATLENDIQVLRAKLEKVTEEKFKAEEVHVDVISRLEKKLADVTEQLINSEADNDELVSKVQGSKSTLDQLLTIIKENERSINSLKKDRQEVESQLVEQMNEMEKHYGSQIKNSAEQISDLTSRLNAYNQEIEEARLLRLRLEESQNKEKELEKIIENLRKQYDDDHKQKSEASLKAYQKEISALKKKVDILEKARSEDSVIINNQLVSGKEHKLKYVDKLRQEAVEKDAKIETLRRQLDALQKSGQGESRRVLRSRNTAN
uniref:Kinesin motor domain-containing protein n=1 Tax=Caenorhabditis japonica TaxID=281687 RepID=A0A8R1E2K8_CAEJA